MGGARLHCGAATLLEVNGDQFRRMVLNRE